MLPQDSVARAAPPSRRRTRCRSIEREVLCLLRQLKKTANLLASMNNFPRKMVIQYAQDDTEAVRAMFLNLYDESKDVTERILQF